MDNNQVAALIEGMAQSLMANPGQFHIHVESKIVGSSVSVNNGGTGISLSVTGGGPGSTTVGMRTSATLSQGNVEIAQKQGAAVMTNEMHQLIIDLQRIAAEFRKPTPEPSTIRGILSSIGAWVPPIITGAVANLISHQLGA